MAKIDDLVSQLQRLSPMPEDSQLNEQLFREYELLVQEMSDFKNPKIIPTLIDSFGYGEGNGVYWKVLHLLEYFEMEQVDPILLERLKTGHRGSKMWAAYMLGRSRNNNAVENLIQTLSDTNHLVRRNAAMALGMIGDRRARIYLEGCLNDISEEVRSVTKGALNSLS